MSNHPYQHIAPTGHWRRAFADVPLEQVDPVTGPLKFQLDARTRVATAGSCFAQHIARHLLAEGMQYLVTEPGHPVATREIRDRFNYGVYSARYGNIYTPRQLLQLLDRAYGRFTPAEPFWRNEAGAWLDPLRPTIEPHGFASEAELLADREQHLRAVRKMFETLDVFVFTLGLTEHWLSRDDGAVFPVCPGVAGGEFDERRHGFGNFSVAEVVGDMQAFRAGLLAVNPGAKIILTVSPVPLMATMEPRHVLVSSTVSKAILRAAADQLEREFDNVAYFPSYEIITSSFTQGRYFAPDLRSVTEAGVAHVMRLFMQHAAGRQASPPSAGPASKAVPSPAISESARFDRDARLIVDTICDENLIDAPVSPLIDNEPGRTAE